MVGLINRVRASKKVRLKYPIIVAFVAQKTFGRFRPTLINSRFIDFSEWTFLPESRDELRPKAVKNRHIPHEARRHRNNAERSRVIAYDVTIIYTAGTTHSHARTAGV